MNRVRPIDILLVVITAVVVMTTGCRSRIEIPHVLQSRGNEIKDGWQYRWGESPMASDGLPQWARDSIEASGWRSFAFPAWAPRDPGPHQAGIWQRVQLPSWPARQSQSLFVRGGWKIFDVYVDGKCVYRYGSRDALGRLIFPGTSWHLIPLEPSFSGKMLVVHALSDDKFVGLYQGVFLGSELDHVLRILREEMGHWLLGFVYLFIGLATILIFFRRSKERANLLFGCLAISIGLYNIARSQLKQLYLYDPAMWNYMELLSFYAIPFWVCTFTESLFGSGRFKMIRRLWQVDLFFVGAIVLLSLVTDTTLWDGVYFYQYFFLAISTLMIVSVMHLAIRGNIDARIYACGFVVGVVGGMHDVLVSIGWIPLRPFISQYGIFVFVMSLGAIVSRRFIQAIAVREGLELARTVQDLLLPKKRRGEFGPFSYSSFYEPLGQVSGDWLNYWEVSEDERRLVFGDVVGKGPQAAIAVSAIAALINTSKDAGASMQECVEKVNAGLRELFGTSITTTLSAIALHRDGQVELFNCGGIGWMRVSKEGVVHAAVRGSSLGISDKPSIGHLVVQPRSGEIFFSFTDGVLEGQRQLKRLVSRLSGIMQAPVSFGEVFAKTVECGRGTVLSDDRSMVIVKASGD